MKKIYCKYCGLELENGKCICIESQNTTNENVSKVGTKFCDTCKKEIDDDSKYCPYCGIPIDANGNIPELQRELKGVDAPDVLEVYRRQDLKRGIKNSKLKKSPYRLFTVIVIMSLIFIISFFTFLLPFIKERISYYQMKKILETASTYEYVQDSIEPIDGESQQVETSQIKIDLRDMWVRQDGYFYAFDKDGEPVIDDWLVETDEDGNEKKYYFDIDGKLVVNTWIDGEYYVGADGAMLKNTATPDGAFVDEEGKVILHTVDEVAVERETHVYYESPDSEAETKSASTQKSSISGEIKGVDPQKKYELYVKNLIQLRETVEKGNEKCNITYYLPIIDGASEKEVNNINEAMAEAFNRFKDELITIAKTSSQLPKSITFSVIEQKTVTSNRMNILTHGKVTPRHGLTEKMKFRFIYDRKSKKVMLADITN